MYDANRPEQALALLQRLGARLGADPEYVFLMSQVHLRMFNMPQAEHFARRAVQLARTPVSLIHLAVVLAVGEKTEESLAVVDQVLAGDPGNVNARLVRCNALMARQRISETLATCEEGLRYGWHPELCVSYASALMSLGEPERCAALLDEAVARFPDEVSLASLRAMAKTAHPTISPEEVAQAHRDFGAAVNRVKPAYTSAYVPEKDAERRLRVGLVSPDLRRHSVAFFVEPLLEHFDRERLEIVCYPTNPIEDEVTKRLKRLASRWRPAVGKIELQLAEMLAEDRIDIAVDLAGHTEGGSLLAFGLRMAPVQATYCGYPDSTGLTQMDWRVVDSHTDPATAEVDARATERLWRLDPCFLCYRPPEEAPTPRLARGMDGAVTFGSFNASRKHNRHVCAVWSKILRAVPNSRLVLKAQDLKDASIRARLLGRFEAEGTADRVQILEAPKSLAAHLELYAQVDIGLDPFPYQGTTTTCEALWMGVPVVTMAGHTHAGRVGVSLLSAVGAPELIAQSEEDFVARAVALAGDGARLARYRAELRGMVAASPLLDGQGFCRRMEGALRGMWRAYCGQ
ncbi:MAG TPA: hypothetical protein VD997_17005 [Phycisphaerales bacterium]|nr:hypothetical protein [Phycisphaerales bacterium]